MRDHDLTHTRSIAAPRGPTTAHGPQLFVVLQGACPIRAPSRHRLRGIDQVRIGRSSTGSIERDGTTLRLGLADPTLSSKHACLRRRPASWELEDLGSKNGTFIDGERITRRSLTGPTMLRAGQTGLLLRPRAEDDPSAPDDLDATCLDGPLGLHTLEPTLARRFAELRRVAASDAAVVVHGETGTGKELAAQAVHALSGRTGPLVAVNCGALSEGLLSSELFGHRKGAFSGATEDREGWVAASHGGTLFLDEIAELPAAAQAALLRVVQEREVVPVGTTTPRSVDLRIVCATHRSLEARVAEGSFREDLLARLSGFMLTLPPVRERSGDRGLLVRALLKDRVEAASVSFTADAVDRLLGAPWPRNVRELERTLSAAIALADDDPIEARHLPETPGAIPGDEPTPPVTARSDDDALRRRLHALLVEHRGNVSAVARAMGKHRQQIQKWIRRLNLDVDALRETP